MQHAAEVVQLRVDEHRAVVVGPRVDELEGRAGDLVPLDADVVALVDVRPRTERAHGAGDQLRIGTAVEAGSGQHDGKVGVALVLRWQFPSASALESRVGVNDMVDGPAAAASSDEGDAELGEPMGVDLLPRILPQCEGPVTLRWKVTDLIATDDDAGSVAVEEQERLSRIGLPEEPAARVELRPV